VEGDPLSAFNFLKFSKSFYRLKAGRVFKLKAGVRRRLNLTPVDSPWILQVNTVTRVTKEMKTKVTSVTYIIACYSVTIITYPVLHNYISTVTTQ
jgi:hypothetical protein